MPYAIRAEHLTKRYRLGKRGTTDRNLTETLGHLARSTWNGLRGKSAVDHSNDFFAVRDVSFEVRPGEVVGIIGRNGAGKSTLLKLLSRIVEPTEGRIEFKGRMGSLLEVGTGFHPELTGRENIFLNGSILGMSRSEIDVKFDEIVEFAEISKFLDTPVKRYSSGMYVRLAFAIAAHLQPEILILDEVLAVGDANFQKKCLGRMKEVSNQGRTVLFVSHDMAAVRRLCTRGILLSGGQVAFAGDIDEAVSRYLEVEGDVSGAGQSIDLTKCPRNAGNGLAKFTSVRFHGPNGGSVVSGQPMEIVMEAETDRELIADSISVLVTDRAGYRLVNTDTIAIDRVVTLKPGKNTLTIKIDSLPLYPGNYLMGFWLAKRPANPYDFIEAGCEFEVVPAEGDGVRPNCDGVVRVGYTLNHS